jgi:hypothetical protein
MNLIRRLRRSMSHRQLQLPSRPKLVKSKSNASITQQEETEQTEHGDIFFMGAAHTLASCPMSTAASSDSSEEECYLDQNQQPQPQKKRPSSVSFAAIEEYALAVPPRRRASYTGPPKHKPAIKAKPRYSCTSLQLQSAQAQLKWTLDIYDKYNNIMGEFDDIVIGGAGWD